MPSTLICVGENKISAPFSAANLGVSKKAISKQIKIAKLIFLEENRSNSSPDSKFFRS